MEVRSTGLKRQPVGKVTGGARGGQACAGPCRHRACVRGHGPLKPRFASRSLKQQLTKSVKDQLAKTTRMLRDGEDLADVAKAAHEVVEQAQDAGVHTEK